jgi:hypothetical protein
MHLQHRKTLLAALLCAAEFIHPCPAQVAPAAVLERVRLFYVLG